MIKRLSISVMIIVLFGGITACGDKTRVKRTDVAQSSTNLLVHDKSVFYPKEGPKSIKIVRDETEITISGQEEYPSPPDISPDKLRLAYISPFEFELAGEVFVYTVEKDSPEKIVDLNDFPDSKSAHRIAWLDDQNLLIVIQSTYGTMSTGGSLAVYNFEIENLIPIEEFNSRQSVWEITVNNNMVTLQIAAYDDNLMNYTLENKVYTKDQIYEVIKQSN